MVAMHSSGLVIGFLVIFSAAGIGCAEGSSETTALDDAAVAQGDLAHAEQGKQPIYEDFDEFYNVFASAVDRSDWEYLAELTRFPFVLKGELDHEGQVTFDKSGFKEAIDELLREEVYLNIDDELIATSFRETILNRKSRLRINGDEAQLSGILFNKKKPDGWKLSEITTHVHIVEGFLEEK